MFLEHELLASEFVGDPSPADWGDAILLTVAQIRSLGLYITAPGITGMSYIDTAYEEQLHDGAQLAFSIDESSAEDFGHDTDDLSIEQRVPGVNESTCDDTSELDFPCLLFNHEGRSGLYGPEPALANDDWVGSAGATNPDALGNFTVSAAAAKLTLTLPCNYGDLLDDVPNENFPTGMPGLPTIGYYHRADIWRSYDGQLGQDGLPYSIPAEARYCWWGFSYIDIPVTGCAGHTMQLKLTVRRHTINETHVSDATRQQDATHSDADVTRTYRAVATASGVIFNVGLAAEESDPDLEQVVSMELSGFALGDLAIDEPELTYDETAGRIVVKVFEGKDYDEGGFSAVVSPTHRYALMDNTEDNGGHDTQSEKTVRMFDYIVGAISGIDTTVAWSLDTIADILTNVCNAWDCSVDAATVAAMVRDDDTPPTDLSTLWCFNVCYPDCTVVGYTSRTDRPLLQAVSGTLNCSLRCRQWSIVTGLVYAIRTDKVIGGAAQGLARSGYTLLRSLADAVVVWRRPNGGGAWVAVQTGVDVDAFGNWHTDSLEEFNPADGLRWEYGISKWGATSPDFSLGYAYVRETVSPGGATINRIYLDWRRNYPFPGYARDGSWLSRFMATALFAIMEHECSADDGQTWTAQKDQGPPDGLPIADAYRWDPDNVGAQLVPHCGDGRKWVPRRDGSM